MKTFCPKCECERETTLYSEVRECTVCREGFEIVCGTEQSNSDSSKSIADAIMEIIHAAVSGDCAKYVHIHLNGKKYCKWGVVEKDIRATLANDDWAKTKEKQLEAELMEVKDTVIKGMREEIKSLRFKTSEQERFIAWVWSVYARNVCDTICAIMGATTYDTEGEAKDGKWALPKSCFDLLKRLDEYTEKIYDGTYQAALPTVKPVYNDADLDAKISMKENKTTVKREDCFLVCQKCRGIVPPQLEKFHYNFCPSAEGKFV